MQKREQRVTALVVWERNDHFNTRPTLDQRLNEILQEGWFIVTMTTVKISNDGLEKIIVVLERNAE